MIRSVFYAQKIQIVMNGKLKKWVLRFACMSEGLT